MINCDARLHGEAKKQLLLPASDSFAAATY